MDLKILKFFSKSCVPCKLLAKSLQELPQLTTVDFTVQDIDIEEDFNSTNQYHINTVPTLVIIGSDGIEITRIVGNCNKHKLLEIIEECAE